MHRWIRLLLVALLAVTLPLKGIAAVSMAACGELHRQAMAVGVMADGANGPAAMHHAHGAEGHDETSPADPLDQGDAGKLKCSTCAPCCAAAAPGFAGPLLVAADLSHRRVQPEQPALVSVTVPRLNRPPISHLA